MKVLIAAIACHPTAGSEAYVGWQAVNILRREHELRVLTSLWCREAIEKTVKAGEGWERVRFVYVDEKRGEKPCHPNRLIARLHSWIDYRRWCKDAGEIARQLIKQEHFDLAHHVTYASWRMGSPLADLGIPWIWGPIGGGERFPWKLARILSPVALCFEIFRSLSTKVSMFSPVVRRAVRDAALILPNNHETEKLVLRVRAKSLKMTRLAQSFLPEERLELLKRNLYQSPMESGKLRCVAGGNLEGRKGVAIALRSLALLAVEGIPFRYTYLGRGPELEHLKALADQLGIAGRVHFVDSLSGDEYVQALQSSHVYLLPSLREGVPVTQMEAMAAGCVPIVAACGGAGPMAIEAGVLPILVGSDSEMAEAIAERLRGLWNLPLSWSTQSESSTRAIREKYSAEHYRTKINSIYRIAVTCSEKR
jgi:glycosyltransferase involved in cell wall biosynthesis